MTRRGACHMVWWHVIWGEQGGQRISGSIKVLRLIWFDGQGCGLCSLIFDS